MALIERDQQLLAFERAWWKHAGLKEQAIRDQFGITATRYYQHINRLTDDPEAYVYDPTIVKRLRRQREERQRARRLRAA